MTTTQKYETGATTHAVNDLILFTDNTRELAELRDSIYKRAFTEGDIINLHYKGFFNEQGITDRGSFKTALQKAFHKLLINAKNQYIKEFPDSHNHILNMSYDQKEEFCQLYADDFENWKAENMPVFILSKDGAEQFRGTENECYFKLQRLQGQSADWAMKYEGWKITKA